MPKEWKWLVAWNNEATAGPDDDDDVSMNTFDLLSEMMNFEYEYVCNEYHDFFILYFLLYSRSILSPYSLYSSYTREVIDDDSSVILTKMLVLWLRNKIPTIQLQEHVVMIQNNNVHLLVPACIASHCTALHRAHRLLWRSSYITTMQYHNISSTASQPPSHHALLVPSGKTSESCPLDLSKDLQR